MRCGLKDKRKYSKSILYSVVASNPHVDIE